MPDPRPVTKVPNAPVSNSLGLKKLGGGVTRVEDPTGSPPKVATACEANITTAKAISLFIFVLDSIPEREQRKAWEQWTSLGKKRPKKRCLRSIRPTFWHFATHGFFAKADPTSAKTEAESSLNDRQIQAGAQNLLMTLWPISDEVTVQIMGDFYEAAHNSGNAPEALAEVQRNWLLKLRTEKGLAQAVNLAGPFIMSSQGKP